LIQKSTTLDDLERHIQGLPKVFKYPLLSQERLSYILQIWPLHSQVHLNKMPLKILEKREHGRIQGLPKIF